VLASGDRLVATARDPRRLADLVQRYSNQVRTAPLDVADEDAAKAAVQAAVDAFGRLDVVVNNAGYGLELSWNFLVPSLAGAEASRALMGLDSVEELQSKNWGSFHVATDLPLSNSDRQSRRRRKMGH
jgi:NAD(P)-dependent dehydrogenase (short-subunit alcohol dehydrogenase family)